jgi:hypothetical protein
MSLFDPAQPEDLVVCPCGWYGPIKLTVCDLDSLVCCPECGEPVERLEPVVMGPIIG